MSDIVSQERRITAWSLIKPYWVSEDRWVARGLLLLVVAMNMSLVYMSVRLNTWNGAFYDAIQNKNAKAFTTLLGEFAIIAAIFIVIAVYRIYFRQMLEFRWRRWLTDRYVRDWLGENAFYRIERDRLTDNPDQRITDDLQSLASSTLSLSLGLLSTVVSLFSFMFILWRLSGPLNFVALGHHFTIPGYMVWVAIVYALAGSWLMHKFGRPLVAVNYQQQRVEADFRFLLVRVRENAEQIAMYNGAQTESGHAHHTFDRIRDNWRLVMRYTKRLTMINALYSNIAGIFPLVVAAPRYFSGALTLGNLTQIGGAFGSVSDSLSWVINNYGELANWRATVNRLREFRRVIEDQHFGESVAPATAHGGINRHLIATCAVTVRDLRLALPNGTPLAAVRDLVITPGSRWLVRGPSGSGKSTLMRALAGLWPFGQGTVEIPVDATVMFVPQQSYMPIGTLRGALSYPAAPDSVDDNACRRVLERVELAAYATRLDETAHWARRLSPGEQQRIAAARVLLQRPDYVFLDEATSALDAASERAVYQALVSELHDSAIVSVAHRKALACFHEHTLDLETGAVPEREDASRNG
jgi:putative ATP-binding cassette transporter